MQFLWKHFFLTTSGPKSYCLYHCARDIDEQKTLDVLKVRIIYLFCKEGVFTQVFKHLHLILREMLWSSLEKNLGALWFLWGTQQKTFIMRDMFPVWLCPYFVYIYLKFLLYSKWARTTSSLIQVHPYEDIWSFWKFIILYTYIPLIYNTKEVCGIEMLNQ